MATNTANEAMLPSAFGLDSIYPNPVSGQARITLSVDRATPVQIDVVDMLGRVRVNTAHDQLSAGAHEIPLSTGELEPGTYLVRITSDSKSESRLITVIR